VTIALPLAAVKNGGDRNTAGKNADGADIARAVA
jgi:hypothetical protein